MGPIKKPPRGKVVNFIFCLQDDDDCTRGFASGLSATGTFPTMEKSAVVQQTQMS